jgi:DNA (cytosine-5)-methyltransferase 1
MKFYEFFAGGGMARAGLGPAWSCLFANDFDAGKARSYAANWGDAELRVGDVARLNAADLPGRADLAWASFPCQDLSLAGVGAGLRGERSGAFWSFWRLMQTLQAEGRAPTLIVLENVCGALTSHGGRDFAAIGAALAQIGYRFGALVIDAVHFVPQSRPRLFIVAASKALAVPGELHGAGPSPAWHTQTLCAAQDKLSASVKQDWLWWRLPPPPDRRTAFADLMEEHPSGVAWHSEAQTNRLLSMMSPVNRRKVQDAATAGRRMVGGVYRRTRAENGARVQRAEVRFDDVAGCLRTPAGGSSRQTIMIVEGQRIRTRLLSPRETARLMGLPDGYVLPDKYNEAYHLTGDGVAPPVVSFLSAHLLQPLLDASRVAARPRVVAVRG